MANHILATNLGTIDTGETYHSKILGTNMSQDQATYRLAPAALNTIHQQATSWKSGPGRSQISGLEIESQRQAFIKYYGNDGLCLQHEDSNPN